jgi:hypothetical protein
VNITTRLSTSLSAALAFALGTAQATDQATPIAGVYVNDAQSSDGIKAAINANVASFNFITRPMARKALESSSPAYRRIVIEQTVAEIVVTFDAHKPIRAPADGSMGKSTGEKGQVSDVRASWLDRQLVLTSSNDNGQKINTFRLSDDRNTLTLNVTLTSPRLNSPLRYELVFHRQ